MADRVFLHVASTKSGTTFLQRVLWAHRDQLLDQQVLLPGRAIGDHYRACIDVREEFSRLTDPGSAVGAWSRLVEEMAAWEGDALVSHELFAPATSAQAAQAIAMLGEAEVHVVVTARDLVRQIPAEWQEHLKHRSVLTFAEFVRELRTEPEHGPFSPNGYHFWHEQDLPEISRRWGHAVPRQRVHVVTVPREGAAVDTLWSRFADLIGIDGASFDLSKGRANSSLLAEQAELMRRLNLQLGSRLPLPGPYPETVKSLLAHQILSGRPGTRFGVVGEDRAFAIARAHTMVAELRQLGVDVVGDLEELVPHETGEEVSGDAQVTAESVLAEAVEALAEVLDRVAVERTRRRRLREELDHARAEVGDLRARLGQAGAGGLSEFATRVARRAHRRVRGRT